MALETCKRLLSQLPFRKHVSLALGSLSLATLAYLLYIKRSYRYLESLGYDGPSPRFLLGNLTEFVSKENSIEKNKSSRRTPAIPHYSKTLQRWTRFYGKVYGYYEGHSPVLVLADADLVAEVFLNQNKLLAYRRSFPMSKHSSVRKYILFFLVSDNQILLIRSLNEAYPNEYKQKVLMVY